MAAVPAATENRLFVIGLGITTCAVIGLMRHMLTVYRDSVEVKKPSPVTQYITQGTEDSLKIRTLEKLIESHSYGIQETATRIVCDRALHDESTVDRLLWELTRPDRDMREHAIRAIYMLTEQPSMAELNKPKVFHAIVTGLSHSARDIPHDIYDKELDSFDFRDPAERFSLLVLNRLISEFGPQEVIKAGIVHKWLAMEPWGRSEEETLENFKHCYANKQSLSYLIMRIARDTLGLEQLVKAKLIATSDCDFFPRDIIMEDETVDRPAWSDITNAEGGPRPREQSAEERHLRRRHREAMVLNDGIQPIGVGDIIERDEREYEAPAEERQQ